MDISVELTLTPLQDDFERPIKEFIKALRKSGCTVLENPLSTQIYGEYDEVMKIIASEMKTTFNQLDHCIMNMKVVKSNRSKYVPSF